MNSLPHASRCDHIDTDEVWDVKVFFFPFLLKLSKCKSEFQDSKALFSTIYKIKQLFLKWVIFF